MSPSAGEFTHWRYCNMKQNIRYTLRCFVSLTPFRVTFPGGPPTNQVTLGNGIFNAEKKVLFMKQKSYLKYEFATADL